MLKQTMTWLAMAVLSVLTAQAQQSRWAQADDADAERSCKTPIVITTKITEKILAGDFWGTLPDGAGYGKAEEVHRSQWQEERQQKHQQRS